VIQQLAGAGFAVLDAAFAFTLRPDVFPSAQNAGFDFSEGWPKLEEFVGQLGAGLFLIGVAGRAEPLRVAARSDFQLADRIRALLGLRVKSIHPVRTFAAPSPEQPVAKALPGEVPEHPCNERAAWFDARGLRDPKFGAPALT
jgi:hypothetical protein